MNYATNHKNLKDYVITGDGFIKTLFLNIFLFCIILEFVFIRQFIIGSNNDLLGIIVFGGLTIISGIITGNMFKKIVFTGNTVICRNAFCKKKYLLNEVDLINNQEKGRLLILKNGKKVFSINESTTIDYGYSDLIYRKMIYDKNK